GSAASSCRGGHRRKSLGKWDREAKYVRPRNLFIMEAANPVLSAKLKPMISVRSGLLFIAFTQYFAAQADPFKNAVRHLFSATVVSFVQLCFLAAATRVTIRAASSKREWGTKLKCC